MSEILASDAVFSAEQLQALKELVGAMIPAKESAVSRRPSAADDLIFADIVRTAADQTTVIERVLELSQEMSIAELPTSGVPEVSGFVALVLQCYYRDARVMAAIGMQPRAPYPEGYEVEQGDWSLLDEVRQRDKFYRVE